ncbi:hypothetical protein ACOSQ4_023119 [Xanthoceras sorbifolium]
MINMLENIQERLDRVFYNRDWGRVFPFAKVFHRDFSASDHQPQLLSLLGKSLLILECLVRNGFSLNLFGLKTRLPKILFVMCGTLWLFVLLLFFCLRGVWSKCATELSSWSSLNFGSVSICLAYLRARIEQLYLDPLSSSSVDHLSILKAELESL